MFDYGPEDYNYADFILRREIPAFERFRERMHVGTKAPDFELLRLDDIAREFAGRGVSSVLVYTREARPGENYGHHVDYETKLHHAKALLDELGVSRPILVDGLDGPCHRAWGLLPNMAWILLRGGTVAYKADWTNPPDVAGALEELLDEQGSGKAPFYNERLRYRAVDHEAFMRGLERNGPKAIADFTRQ